LHRLKKGVEGNGAGYPEMGSGHSGVARNRPTDKKKRSIQKDIWILPKKIQKDIKMVRL